MDKHSGGQHTHGKMVGGNLQTTPIFKRLGEEYKWPL
jgi:hypothetical protein